ncbi:hypothetical protein E0I26_02725 [Flavobacterium rhamnosiphilum]|uniref:Cell wall anchor protein n=1 Tax=Flavobacterium rhamnosiphilum TaxID=2541724 RepID=A0A4R5FDI0_9FLAO|nr:hypothetical protein [Flavobacterium rhamnosiphilum]TDE47020.1 hypothetical protein E0I26_02725 [Flavobacterium rhamnosiphilum]
MKKNYFSKKVLQACLLFFMIITANVFAQVGIGTITPHASSVLDVSSTTQGMLTPRMTTVQRTAIVTPADGLIVYDTDLKSFYHYNSTLILWIRLNSEANGRLKFKRIKSTDVLATVLAAEKTAGGNTKYLLDVNTYYEINGTINVDLPIDLNNAYVSGMDANEDVLVRTSGNLFDGATGGSIRNVTIQVTGGGKVFNLNGAISQSLIIRDAIIAGSSNVGSITGFGLVFVSIVQFVGNAAGITYDTIGKLLINNAAWFSNNTGTYEKLQGTFGLVQKQGGFSEVTGASIGLDVSSNPVITGDAVMETVVFTGVLTTGKYVKGYTVGSYTGYSFNDFWTVRSTGIPNEGDSYATGNLYLNRTITSPTIQLTDTNGAYKVPGTTISTNLFRISGSTTNRLVYLGRKARTFTVAASVSFEGGTGSADLLFYFVKFASGGTPYTFITSSETFIDSNTANVQSFSVSGTISLANGEYVELYAQRLNGTNKTFTFRSYNMSMK